MCHFISSPLGLPKIGLGIAKGESTLISEWPRGMRNVPGICHMVVGGLTPHYTPHRKIPFSK
jgi:hypothetical protein